MKGEEIRQVVPSADGTRIWVAAAAWSNTADSGGVYLLDIEGRSLLPGGALLRGEEVLSVVTRSGLVWLMTQSGKARFLDENGTVLGSKDQALPWAQAPPKAFHGIFPFLLGSDDILLWETQAFHVRGVHGSIEVTPLLKGLELLSADAEPTGDGAWLQSAQDNNLYFISLRKERYLEEHLVLKSANAAYVFPAGDGLHGWIQGIPTSFAYVPLSEVGAALKLEGGSLEVKNGRDVTLQGRLNIRAPLRQNEASSIELRWPGRDHATQAAGVLEFSLWDERTPHRLVASGTRRFSQGAPPPQLQWNLDDLFVQDGLYRIVFRYYDQTGIDTTLVLHHIPFRTPLIEQVWFRTGIACVMATMLLGIPLVLLPRTRSARSWLPFIGWTLHVLAGSGLAFSDVAHRLKIHFPTFVGVLFVEVLLGLLLGAFSPPVFRLLAGIKPFQWLTPLALAVPGMRRRLFANYVAHGWRKLMSQRRQANNERYVSLPADLREGGVHPGQPDSPEAPRPPGPVTSPETHIRDFLTVSEWHPQASVLIESPGGRGKSALLRESIRQLLLRFEQDPSGPLPVFCDARSGTLLEAVQRALEADPLLCELQEAMLQRGDYVLVVDGLTESLLSSEAIQSFLDGKYGRTVRLLCTSRPHDGFRHAIESSSRWLHVQPRRLDEETLGWFIDAYRPEGAPELRAELLAACRGPDGTYLPILVRLALMFGHGPASNVSELYEAAFRGLLRRQDSSLHDAEDSELLAWSSALCLRTYWANGVRALRYRNAPERPQLEKLLKAGVLIPDEPSLERSQTPLQVRFFHDSMQSYLTACGLFAQEHARPTWEVLWRAAADPLFTSAQSELLAGAGSELFQMCLEVFGPEERLRRELQRQLLEWSRLYDDSLTKRDIIQAVPTPLQRPFHQRLQDSSALAPRDVLGTATAVCAQAGLPMLGVLYMRIATLVWPFRESKPRVDEGGVPPESPEAPH
ncbi:hypothetical protein [Hyalangium rubrum]|uniref:NACHT domain-containing protein n=1 Tax=Hyalangium rubrum TaxID=3103134 RepID=A0ABU5GXB8_9BACT|nr:hypothetical protein [Hyalangium sp. s54d21]MDY7225676.1 hypothetical protein [Hyalangium sp. s54d21]